MSASEHEQRLGHSGLNNVNLSGCVVSRPRLRSRGGRSECRFWVCDGLTPRDSKFSVEAVARGELAMFLEERLAVDVRVAITGSMQAQGTAVAGGEILDYELAVSHADPGEALQGRCVERSGLNEYVLSGVVTKEPEIRGLPGRDRSVFWMCDGDSEEESGVRLPVFLAPGKVSELAAEISVGDRLAVAGYLRSRRRWVSGASVYEYEMVGCYVDGGFLVGEGG